MNDKRVMTNFTKSRLVIPAYEVGTLEFMGTVPNYFRVQNSGDHSVYCSPNNIPTVDRYDFTVSSGGLSMYAEPTGRDKLHIYNPSGTAITCTVFAFRADFDPLVLALSNIELDMPDVLETNNVISSFTTSLPAGNNVIGKVNVNNFPTDYAKSANQKDYTETLSSILSALSSIGGAMGGGAVGGGSVVAANRFAPDSNIALESFSFDEDNTEYIPNAGIATKINFIANDGTEDMKISFNNIDIVIKAGEVLNDVDVYIDGAVMFNTLGTTIKGRALFTCYKV